MQVSWLAGSFYLPHFSETNWVSLNVCLGSVTEKPTLISSLSSWQQIFYQGPFKVMKCPSTMWWKIAPPNLTVGMVFLGRYAEKLMCIKCVPHLTRLIFSQYFAALSKCCLAHVKRASTCFFFQQWRLEWWACMQVMAAALFIVFFETVVTCWCQIFL